MLANVNQTKLHNTKKGYNYIINTLTNLKMGPVLYFGISSLLKDHTAVWICVKQSVIGPVVLNVKYDRR